MTSKESLFEQLVASLRVRVTVRPDADGWSYDSPFDAAEVLSHESQVALNTQDALTPPPEFFTLPLSRQDILFKNLDGPRIVVLTRNLVEYVFSLRNNDPAGLLPLYDRLLTLLGVVPSTSLPVSVLGSLRGRVVGHKANALRIVGQLDAARSAFEQALLLLEDHSADPTDEAEICCFLAALERESGRFALAASLLDSAIRTFRLYSHDYLPKAVVARGVLAINAEDYSAALRFLSLVENLTNDPVLLLAAGHNSCIALLLSGQPRDAYRRYTALKPLYRHIAPRAFRVRGSWLEGMIYLDLAWASEAQTVLLDAFQGLVELRLPLPVALAALELAAAYLMQGKVEEAWSTLDNGHLLATSFGLGAEPAHSLQLVRKAISCSASSAAELHRLHQLIAAFRRLQFNAPPAE